MESVETIDLEGGQAPAQPNIEVELSRKAQEMGESRKLAYQALLDVANSSPEAKAKLLDLASSEKEKAYLEEKFGEKFTSLLKPHEPAPVTEVKIPDEVLSLVEERKAEKQSQIKLAKERFGITDQDEKTFDDLVNVLSSQVIGGRKYTLAEAIEFAGRQINPTLASTPVVKSDVAQKPEDKKEEEGIPEEYKQKFAKYLGIKS